MSLEGEIAEFKIKELTASQVLRIVVVCKLVFARRISIIGIAACKLSLGSSLTVLGRSRLNGRSLLELEQRSREAFLERLEILSSEQACWVGEVLLEAPKDRVKCAVVEHFLFDGLLGSLDRDCPAARLACGLRCGFRSGSGWFWRTRFGLCTILIDIHTVAVIVRLLAQVEFSRVLHVEFAAQIDGRFVSQWESLEQEEEHAAAKNGVFSPAQAPEKLVT